MNKRIIKKFEVAEQRRIDELLAELRRVMNDVPDAWLQIWTWKSEFVSNNDDATALFALYTYYGNPDGEYFPNGQVYSTLNARNLETAIRQLREYVKGVRDNA